MSKTFFGRPISSSPRIWIAAGTGQTRPGMQDLLGGLALTALRPTGMGLGDDQLVLTAGWVRFRGRSVLARWSRKVANDQQN